MLPVLLEVPKTQEDWTRWGFHHRQSHRVIRAGIVAMGGQHLTDYILDPVDLRDFSGFLERNNHSHQDEAGVLRTVLFDLQDVNYKDESELRAWIYTHWQLHQAEELAAGVAS